MVLITHHIQSVGTHVIVQTQSVPLAVTDTTVDNMGGVTFTTIICNPSLPLGGTTTSTTKLHRQELMIMDHVTT
jgi:hypothetical protein